MELRHNFRTVPLCVTVSGVGSHFIFNDADAAADAADVDANADADADAVVVGICFFILLLGGIFPWYTIIIYMVSLDVFLTVVAAALLVWTLTLAFMTRARVQRLQYQLETGMPDCDSMVNARRLMAFSVVYDGMAIPRDATVSDSARDVHICECNGKVEVTAGVFGQIAWFPLKRETSARELEQLVVSGRARYLIIAGTVVRVAWDASKSTLLLMNPGSFLADQDQCTPAAMVPALRGTVWSSSHEGNEAWWDLMTTLITHTTANGLPFHVFVY